MVEYVGSLQQLLTKIIVYHVNYFLSVLTHLMYDWAISTSGFYRC